jgi:hypothetical protein
VWLLTRLLDLVRHKEPSRQEPYSALLRDTFSHLDADGDSSLTDVDFAPSETTTEHAAQLEKLSVSEFYQQLAHMTTSLTGSLGDPLKASEGSVGCKDQGSNVDECDEEFDQLPSPSLLMRADSSWENTVVSESITSIYVEPDTKSFANLTDTNSELYQLLGRVVSAFQVMNH